MKDKTIDLVLQTLYKKIHVSEEKNITTLQEAGKSIQIIKGIRAENTEKIKEAEKMQCDMLLIDSYDKDIAGGTGKKIAVEMIPKMHKPYILNFQSF